MKQMKKLLCGLLMVCMVLTGICIMPQSVQAANDDFVIENGVLKKYNGMDKAVTIPSNVKEIGMNAFSGNKNIVSVTIPDGVTYIGSNAFNECTNLSQIVVPKTVTNIDYFAFSETAWLAQKQMERKDHLVIINDRILYDGRKCNGKVVIPSGVTLVCPYAFYYNDKITEMTVPQSVKICDTRCFGGCTSLKSITFKNKNTKMNYDWSRVKTKSGANGAFYAGDYYFVMMEDVQTISTTLTIKGYRGSTAEKAAKNLVKYPWGNQQVKFVDLKTKKTTCYGVPTQLKVKKGQSTKSLQISFVKEYQDGVDISYKSSDKKVAVISADGKLTTKKKGTALITIKISEKGIVDGYVRTFKTKVVVK